MGQVILAQLTSGAVEKAQGCKKAARGHSWEGPQESCRTAEKSRPTPRKEQERPGGHLRLCLLFCFLQPQQSRI